jgi:stage II sporulation protein D
LTLLIIIIPVFIVFITIKETKEQKKEDGEKSRIFVRLKREETGQIEKIELEEYVIGVLAGEMPISFHLEALKAQAVAARSYVLNHIEANRSSEFDVIDTTTNQVYQDDIELRQKWQNKYEENINKLKEAVSNTRYQYLEYNGTIADALFFSTSNGFTENSEEIFSAEVPYLRSVESEWDKNTSPVFNDQKSFSIDEFYNLLGIQKSEELNINVISKSSTGRILKLSINGVQMKGSDVVTKLKIRSNDFEIKKEENIIKIITTGYGHGVGMSQYGALGMANEGYTYQEILKHYYKGVNIVTLKN